jgi:hypothetical protein
MKRENKEDDRIQTLSLRRPQLGQAAALQHNRSIARRGNCDPDKRTANGVATVGLGHRRLGF